MQEHEVALVSVTEMFDTSTPQGMLFLQMLGSFAEFERAISVTRCYMKSIA
ncbi:recombinase family protein [Clostridium sp.]|uniref:recombinase family protein n=1 Tax=Clostridium sp. TaxID=1506 RepID=UPI003F302309